MAQRSREEPPAKLEKYLITKEIPRADWPEFLKELSRRHRGRIVTVKGLREDIGAQEEAQELPLQDLSFELKGPGPHELTVILGRDRPWNHIIQSPTHLRFETTVDGFHQAIQIEAADGFTTLITFSADPEDVRGLLPS